MRSRSKLAAAATGFITLALAGGLSAEDLRTPDVAALATKQIHFERFQLEQGQEIFGL